MKKNINTAKAPAAIGPYSQAIEASPFVYTSGMLGIDPSDGQLKGDIYAQAEQALKNLSELLKEAGLSMDDIIKTTVFITDMACFSGVNEIYAKYFAAPYPSRSCVEVSKLPKGASIEIEAIALKK
ncbi:MAG: RidA family protein [Papillibacter sp.]|jgi:2-iminobutanoate/2-iminopropanoate deaminase|nr:RidA family protein [Papillibacter sp.]